MLLRQSMLRRVLMLFILIFIGISLYLVYICQACSESLNCDKAVVVKSKEVEILTTPTWNKNGHKLCIVVPFRDRWKELLKFAPHMHKFLVEQGVAYEIWVINQGDNYRFNRASLINAGFKESSRSCDYIALHDVDLLPINPRLKYSFPEDSPFHIAAPGLHPKYDYPTFIGGILLITRAQFIQVNGMSNKYWGWGLEDDEFFVRLRQENLMVRRPENVRSGRTNSFHHVHETRARDMKTCYNQRNATRRRDRQTGLNTLLYDVNERHKLSIDGVEVNLVSVNLYCDTNFTPWCNCTGAPPDTGPHDKTRDEDVVVPLIKRNRNKQR